MLPNGADGLLGLLLFALLTITLWRKVLMLLLTAVILVFVVGAHEVWTVLS